MAKEIRDMDITYAGDPAGSHTKTIIHYCVNDTTDTGLLKCGQIDITDTPTTVDWADAVSRINTAEGIS